MLLARRPPHKHLPLVWEFPGGKVEPGEAPEQALEREIAEELHCRLTKLLPLPEHEHVYPTLRVRLLPFLARLAPDSPEPRPSEHVAVAWVAPGEFADYELAPADLPVLRDYLALRRA